MKGFLNWLDSRPRIVKILFCLPVIDIIWAVYRILLAISKGNVLQLVLGILWIFFGGMVGWILDLIWIILFNRIFWFKN